MSSAALGPDWVVGADGVPFRRAARVLLLDGQDRLLLVRGHDVDQPERSWWFTVGGGIDTGESAEHAAVREGFAEETGLQIAESDLVGPVLTRSAIFDFFHRDVRQDEVFFLARVADPGEITREGWTDVEREFMDEARWWSAAELADVDIEVFPRELPQIAAALIAGWDGSVRHLGLQDDDAPGEAVPQ